MVQNQAKVTQLAPATNEKSSCLQQLRHQSVVACFVELPGGRRLLQTAWGQNGIGAGALARPKHQLWDLQGFLWLKAFRIF